MVINMKKFVDTVLKRMINPFAVCMVLFLAFAIVLSCGDNSVRPNTLDGSDSDDVLDDTLDLIEDSTKKDTSGLVEGGVKGDTLNTGKDSIKSDTSAVVGDSIKNDTSNVVKDSTGIDSSAIVKDSTKSDTSSTVKDSVIIDTSVIIKDSTKDDTSDVVKDSVIFYNITVLKVGDGDVNVSSGFSGLVKNGSSVEFGVDVGENSELDSAVLFDGFGSKLEKLEVGSINCLTCANNVSSVLLIGNFIVRQNVVIRLYVKKSFYTVVTSKIGDGEVIVSLDFNGLVRSGGSVVFDVWRGDSSMLDSVVLFDESENRLERLNMQYKPKCVGCTGDSGTVSGGLVIRQNVVAKLYVSKSFYNVAMSKIGDGDVTVSSFSGLVKNGGSVVFGVWRRVGSDGGILDSAVLFSESGNRLERLNVRFEPMCNTCAGESGTASGSLAIREDVEVRLYTRKIQ